MFLFAFVLASALMFTCWQLQTMEERDNGRVRSRQRDDSEEIIWMHSNFFPGDDFLVSFAWAE